jgi:hypothetical protein
MEKILIFFIILINIDIIFPQNENIYFRANAYGFDLSNSDDMYFHDICINLEFIKKDVTLDYRRKYFYFPKKASDKKQFQRPLRNNFKECFFLNNSVNTFFNNISLIIILIFLIQFFLIIRIHLNSESSLHNIPNNKIKRNNKSIQNKNITNNDNKNQYTKFTSEEKKEEGKIYKVTENVDINQNQNFINESTRPIFDGKENNNQQKIGEEIANNDEYIVNETYSKINVDKLKTEQEEKGDNKNNLGEVYIPKEKSTDNYTFGINFGTNLNKSIQNNAEEKKENVKEKKLDKLKRIKQIYEEINPTKKKMSEVNNNNNKIKDSNHNDMNSDTIISFGNIESQKVYVREEYFYFKYLLARIEDKRSLSQIYLDLLEQNQFFIKFFSVPYNIYEDRKLQILYYLTKIDIYFLINSYFITSSVINDIYDNKNKLIFDILRSFKTSIITYFICLFLYNLTNIKKVLIKRRYKLINMKLSNKLVLSELIGITKKLCTKFLYHKIIIFFILIIFTVEYTFYICYSFCKVYQYTQLLLLKNVIFSMIITQTIPFFVCWIPAILRKKSLDLKSTNLYEMTKLVEFFFIP